MAADARHGERGWALISVLGVLLVLSIIATGLVSLALTTKRISRTERTQLEAAAACPFRHFIERGLGVRALEDSDRDTAVWMDPATRGSMLHDL